MAGQTWPSGPISGVPGPQGDPGPAGPQGSDGPVGPAGSPGIQGVPGPAGSDGQPGAVGPSGSPGPAGATGPTGPQGQIGPAGETGPAGLNFQGNWSASVSYVVDDLVTYSGSGWYCYVPVGPSATPPTSDSAHWSLLVLQGAPGPQGALGPAGATGATGPSGPTGATGPAGAQGPAGIQGIQGTTGPIGPTGPTGPTGNAGPPGGGALSGTTNSALTNSVTSFAATLSSEWPTGTVNSVILVDSELMKLNTVTPGTGQNYTLAVTRGQFGTTAATHKNNAVLYLRPNGLATQLPSATGTTKVGTSYRAAREDHDHGVTGGTGGGSSTLAGLTDVAITAPAQGHGLYYNFTTSKWTNSPGIAGPTGPAGATGATGATGAQGPIGPAGATGAQGPTGATGATGPAGTQGPAGIGVPTGGRIGQALVKASTSDYDTTWGVKITVSSTAPSSPATGDLWMDTS